MYRQKVLAHHPLKHDFTANVLAFDKHGLEFTNIWYEPMLRHSSTVNLPRGQGDSRSSRPHPFWDKDGSLQFAWLQGFSGLFNGAPSSLLNTKVILG
jgi:hypothetical protein